MSAIDSSDPPSLSGVNSEQAHRDGAPRPAPAERDRDTGVSADECERRFAAVMGENIAWLEAHAAELLRQHPDWADQYVAVASRTPSKIVAVAADRAVALDEGLKAAEVGELARREGLPPGSLLTALLLGNRWDLADL